MNNTNVTNQDNVSSKDISNKDKVYTWIKYLCVHHNVPGLKNIPVMVSREYIANKFKLSIRQITRILTSLEEENKIYRHKLYNSVYIYSITPIDASNDMIVRIRP